MNIPQHGLSGLLGQAVTSPYRTANTAGRHMRTQATQPCGVPQMNLQIPRGAPREWVSDLCLAWALVNCPRQNSGIYSGPLDGDETARRCGKQTRGMGGHPGRSTVDKNRSALARRVATCWPRNILHGQSSAWPSPSLTRSQSPLVGEEVPIVLRGCDRAAATWTAVSEPVDKHPTSFLFAHDRSDDARPGKQAKPSRRLAGRYLEGGAVMRKEEVL